MKWFIFHPIDCIGIEFKSFEEARKFVRSLNLKSTSEWKDYKNNENFTIDIPKKPDSTYLNKGWISMGDWLGKEK